MFLVSWCTKTFTSYSVKCRKSFYTNTSRNKNTRLLFHLIYLWNNLFSGYNCMVYMCVKSVKTFIYSFAIPVPSCVFHCLRLDQVGRFLSPPWIRSGWGRIKTACDTVQCNRQNKHVHLLNHLLLPCLYLCLTHDNLSRKSSYTCDVIHPQVTAPQKGLLIF